jgi:hypothetical protein
MNSLEKLQRIVSAGLPETLAAEILDFAEFATAKDAERKRQVFEEWKRTCPIDDEPITPEEQAAIDAARAEPGSIPAEVLYRELNL